MSNALDIGDANIEPAAAWLAEHWHVAPQPITRTLRTMFGLAFGDACKAIAEARRICQRPLTDSEQSR